MQASPFGVTFEVRNQALDQTPRLACLAPVENLDASYLKARYYIYIYIYICKHVEGICRIKWRELAMRQSGRMGMQRVAQADERRVFVLKWQLGESVWHTA